MKNISIAMLGSGFVADFYLQGLQNVNGQTVVLNYSRSAQRARKFAERWGVPYIREYSCLRQHNCNNRGTPGSRWQVVVLCRKRKANFPS